MEYVLNENNDLISINTAQKKKEYKCIDTLCNTPVIFCNGEIRQPYFKHKSTCHCTCYNKCLWNLGESNRHLNAKYKLFEMLKNNDFITIKQPRKCIKCFINMSKIIKINTIGYKPHLEFSYNLTNKLKKLDVALNNDINTIGFEIYSTNKTKEINRADIVEWYEFDAHSININDDDEELICRKIYNESNYKCSNCVNKEIEMEKQTIIHYNNLVLDELLLNIEMEMEKKRIIHYNNLVLDELLNKKIETKKQRIIYYNNLVLDELLNIEKEKQDKILNIKKEKENKILELEKIEKEKNEKIKLDKLNKYQKQVDEENKIKQDIILKEERRIKNEERLKLYNKKRKLERNKIKELVRLTGKQMKEYKMDLVLDYLELSGNPCCSYENLEKYNLLEYFNVL